MDVGFLIRGHHQDEVCSWSRQRLIEFQLFLELAIKLLLRGPDNPVDESFHESRLLVREASPEKHQLLYVVCVLCKVVLHQNSLFMSFGHSDIIDLWHMLAPTVLVDAHHLESLIFLNQSIDLLLSEVFKACRLVGATFHETHKANFAAEVKGILSRIVHQVRNHDFGLQGLYIGKQRVVDLKGFTRGFLGDRVGKRSNRCLFVELGDLKSNFPSANLVENSDCLVIQRADRLICS